MALPAAAVADEVLNLNVGGCIYTTSRSTLARYPHSMLGSMFSGRLPTKVDDRNRYVIDGDGPTFRHILNFLRRSKLILPDGFEEWDILSAEADYYQIQELIQTINEIKRIRLSSTSYEFLEVEHKSKQNQWMIYCKPHLIDQLSATSKNWFMGGLTDREYQDFKSQCMSSNSRPTSENGFAIKFFVRDVRNKKETKEINRLQLFKEITKLGFRLASASSRCGLVDGHYS